MLENYEQGLLNLRNQFKIESFDFIEKNNDVFSNSDKEDFTKSFTDAFMICEEFSYDREDIKRDLLRVARGENPYDVIFNKENKLTSKFFNSFRKKATSKENIASYISKISSVIETYKRQEEKIIFEGKELRKKNGFSSPEFMEGQEIKVIKTSQINSAGKNLLIELSFLNKRINGQKRLKIENENGKEFISYGENKMKPVSFFERRRASLSSLCGKIDFNDKELLSVVEKGDSKGFKRFLKTRKEEGKNTVNKELSRALEDEFTFNHLSYGLKENNLENVISSAIRMYESVARNLEAETSKKLEISKKDDLSIDMLVFTQSPTDIARMSNYSDNIESCMSPKRKSVIMANQNDEFLRHGKEKERLSEGYLNLGKEIGAGTIAVFGINSKNPLNKLARVCLKPYENANGETLFKVGKDYGISISGFREKVEKIVNEKINKKDAKGIFVLKEGVYSDNEPTMIVKSEGQVAFKDILDAMKSSYSMDNEGNISVKGDVDFGKIAIDLDKISYPKEVKINGMANFCHRDDLKIIPKEIKAKEYNIFGCDNFRYVRPDTPDDAFFMTTEEVVKKYKNNYRKDFENNPSYPKGPSNSTRR